MTASWKFCPLCGHDVTIGRPHGKIDWIKHVRGCQGLGLREAKDIVDVWFDAPRPLTFDVEELRTAVQQAAWTIDECPAQAGFALGGIYAMLKP